MIKTINKTVAVKPFELTEVKHMKPIAGMEIAEDRKDLKALEVVYASDDGRFNVGDTVYVYAETAYHFNWPKVVYVLNNVKFVLVPVEQIILHQFSGYTPASV